MLLRIDSILFFVAILAPGSCLQANNKDRHSTVDHETEFLKLPHTHVLYHHVETACAADVEKFCVEAASQAALPQTTGDPLLDWLFLPSSPFPPEIRDLTRMMDRLFDPLFIEPSRDFVTVFWVQEPHQAPQFLIDSVATKAAQARQPEEIPQLANDLQRYGNELLLKHDENSFQYRMARRLTEMDAATIQNNVNLPFGPTKNRCMRQALADGKLSRGCAASIQEMQTTYTLESQLEKRQDMFLVLMWVYIAALCVLLLQLARRMRSQRSKRHLSMRILQAVYNNQDIKRQVEDDLGHSVGNVPPLPLHALSLIGRSGQGLKHALRCMRRMHMVLLAVMFMLILVAPFWVLPFCIVVSIVRVVELCLMPSNTGDSECACCCCGATSSANANYVLMEDGECCACCKGTGVCAPSCADCCGPKALDNSTENRCCNKGMMVQDCTCCCCGATPSQGRDGTLTVEQACCNCCKGTGTCCAACAACCGNGCCCPMKEVKDATSEDCTCCCCGATPSQARDGTLTVEQACCNCCKGTGACCAACADCCGNGCCCPMKEVKDATSEDCTCCCCGATPSQARDGTLTVEQACCNCCKGTGACCAACADCCGGDDNVQKCAPKGRGQKHVVPVRNDVYCGIPLQVV